MGLNLVPRLGEFFERIKSLEKKVRDLEQGSANSYSRPSRGFEGVIGTLDEDLFPGSSADMTVTTIGGVAVSPTITEQVWLPNGSNYVALSSGSMVRAYSGFLGAQAKYVVVERVVWLEGRLDADLAVDSSALMSIYNGATDTLSNITIYSTKLQSATIASTTWVHASWHDGMKHWRLSGYKC